LLHAVPFPGFQPPQVEASFSTLLDDEEEEFEYEDSSIDEFVEAEDDVDETLIVDNLGLSEEVRLLQHRITHPPRTQPRK
jgi:hypothetical protein